MKLNRATGAATWLFTGHEFVYRAGTGSGASDERLQREVLSKLASICDPSEGSFHAPCGSNDSTLAHAIHYPGSVKSLLVAPIYHGRRIAGALAVFSVEFNAFTERDATTARLLAGLLTYALVKAAEAELQRSVSLERATMLRAIDQLVPALRKLAEDDKPESHVSPNTFSSPFTELDLGSEPATVQAGAITKEPGNGVLDSRDRPSSLRAVMETIERNLRDCPTPEEGMEQTRNVVDCPSPPADLAPEQTHTGESTCAPAAPNILTSAFGVRSALAAIHERYSVGLTIDLWDLAHGQLNNARFWMRATTEHILGVFRLATHQLRVSLPAEFRVKVRVLSAAAVPAVVLLIVPVFLFLRTTASQPSNGAMPTSETSAAAKLAAGSISSQDLHQRSGAPANRLSHMQVTDPAVSSALRTLSRYEIAGLRRRAVYGDDAAAFLLGMAYETGHLVPQDCVQAGKWVTKSANEGNPAAEYNLGLRYQEGDGEPVNQEEGAMWLRKAAAQKYSQAQLVPE